MEYEPELGQMFFGQPHKQYTCSKLVVAALREIQRALDHVMWNVYANAPENADNDKWEYDNPFFNTGNSFTELDEFKVYAYDWREDEVEQPFNFKWNDIEISWYKYLGRGMSCNMELTPDLINTMLNSCINALDEFEERNKKD